MFKNEYAEFVWKQHSSYSTIGEAKLKSVRIELFTGKPTKILEDKITNSYWIMVGFNSQTKKINRSLPL